MQNAATMLSALAAANPSALTLAKYASLATRIEPELLRELRIQLLPKVHADVEATLWLSDLVEFRSPVAATFHRDIQTLLRQTLATEPQVLDDAWKIIEQVHRVRPATIRQEEKLIWLGLSNNTDALQKELQAIINSLLDPARPGISAWAIRSLQQLPENILALEEAKMLALGASFRTEDTPEALLKNIAPEELANWSTWLKPSSLATVTIAVRLLEDDIIEFCPPNQPHSHSLTLPDTFPLTVTLRWKNTANQWHSEHCKIKQGEYVQVKVPDTEIELVTRLGEKYRITKPSIHDQLSRIKKPRVHLSYDVERDGAQIKQELPVVIGVMADLTGDMLAGDKGALRDRKFVPIDRDNFDGLLQQLSPQLNLTIVSHRAVKGHELLIALKFHCMGDFSPANFIYQSASHLEQINNHDCLVKLKQFLTTSPEALELFEKHSAELSSSNSNSLNGAFFSEFADKFDVSINVLQTTLVQIINDKYSLEADIISTITNIIIELEAILSADIQTILQHPKFLALESKWRGLHYLVNNVEQNSQLKIRVLNVSKQELYDDFQSIEEKGYCALEHHVYQAEFGIANGQPYTAIIGDYYFATQAQDVDLLTGLSQLCARSFCPFIAAANPNSFDMDSWTELSTPSDLVHVQERQRNFAWSNFREDLNARFVTLTLPRVLARMPHNEVNIGASLSFSEIANKSSEDELDNFCWMNSAYSHGICLAKSFAETGWGSAIRGVEGGGKIDGLPTHMFLSDDNDMGMLGPTETVITYQREAELSQLGYLPLCHNKNVDYAVFLEAQTLFQAPAYDDADATANAAISARLPYVFAASRFVQYLKVMARDKIGSFMAPEDIEQYLNRWLFSYVNNTPDASAEMKARYPLANCRLQLAQQKGSVTNDGSYKVQLWLQPWLPMEGLTASLLEEFDIPEI